MCIPAGDGIGIVTKDDGTLAVSLFGSLPVVTTAGMWDAAAAASSPEPRTFDEARIGSVIPALVP